MATPPFGERTRPPLRRACSRPESRQGCKLKKTAKAGKTVTKLSTRLTSTYVSQLDNPNSTLVCAEWG